MASVIWADEPSGFAGADAPNPPRRAPQGSRRWIALTAAALLLGAAGFAQGASTAIGIDGVFALAGEGVETVPVTRVHRRDRLGGSFWAPAGSIARPPELHLQGRRWTPAAQPARPLEETPPSASGAEPGQHPTPGDHR